MRNLDYLKRRLLKSISFDSESYFKRMSSQQMMRLYAFFLQPSDENYYLYVIEELRAKREKLAEERWPSQLKGEDWEVRLRGEYGLPPMPEVKTSKETSIKKEEVASSMKKRIEPSEPVKFGDPFRSDGFGTLLGEEEEGIKPPLNKVRIF